MEVHWVREIPDLKFALMPRPPDPAFAMLSRARGVLVPDTEAQAEWVREFMRGQSGRE